MFTHFNVFYEKRNVFWTYYWWYTIVAYVPILFFVFLNWNVSQNVYSFILFFLIKPNLVKNRIFNELIYIIGLYLYVMKYLKMFWHENELYRIPQKNYRYQMKQLI